ncbi:MAG: GNAT family N-acetyltransferase [Fusobacteriaceae bacterium]|jgi:RimJ/RimL family protein N-acetyltransferase|nr:GNAT family N-acetyltransferase [Fusobacteriaceae bacterium]
MIIRKATEADLPEMLKLYEIARQFMRENGNPTQWGDDYPKVEVLKNDMAAGRSYAVTDDAGKDLIATFCFYVGIEPVYNKIEQGKWLNDAPYGVIHRITTAGKNKGLGAEILDWCLDQCGNVRIDTHRDNHPMQKVLEKRGYQYCGVIQWEDGTDRIAFQKVKFSENT